MEYTVNLIIPLQRCTIYFNFKHSEACIVVGLGPYSIVYYEVVFQYSVIHLYSGRERRLSSVNQLSLKICNPLNFTSPTATVQIPAWAQIFLLIFIIYMLVSLISIKHTLVTWNRMPVKLCN